MNFESWLRTLPRRLQRGDVPLGEDLDAAAHGRFFEIDEDFHDSRSPFQCETRCTSRRSGATGISLHPRGRTASSRISQLSP